MKTELVINSKIEELRKVEKFVDELSIKYSLNSEIYGNVLIATLEGVNNAIVHGNKLLEDLTVSIFAELNDKNQLVITIEDLGNGFDYNNIPDPTAPENIENISGRGIFLMKKLSDDVEFLRNGATVKIYFNLKN